MQRRTRVLASSMLLVLGGALTGSPAVGQEGGAAARSGRENVALAVILAKGSKLGYEQQTEIEHNRKFGDMDTPSTSRVNSTWVETCGAVDQAGVSTIRSKHIRVHGSFSDHLLGECRFDSDAMTPERAGESSVLLQNLRRSLESTAGMELEVRLGRDASVVSAEIVVPGGFGDQNPTEMAREMVGLGNFPKDPVGAGDSWTTESTLAVGMGLSLKRVVKHTVKSIEADAVTVGLDGQATKLPAGADAPDSPRPSMETRLIARMQLDKVKIAGTASLSRKDGRLLSMQVDSTVHMSVPETEGGGFSMTYASKARITRLARLPEPANKESAKVPPGTDAK